MTSLSTQFGRDDWSRFTFKQRMTRYAIFLGCALAIAWALTSIEVIWPWVWGAPEQIADLFGRMYPPDPSNLETILKVLWDTVNIATFATTFAVLLCTTRSTLEDRTEVVINRRRIPGKQVLRAVGITLASAGVVVLMTMLLGLGDTEAGVLGDEDFTFLEKLFTCVSAFASVGFDLGITARLDRWGQLVLLVGMFIGRLGILLLLSALFGRRPPSRVRYPQEELIL